MEYTMQLISKENVERELLEGNELINHARIAGVMQMNHSVIEKLVITEYIRFSYFQCV